MLSKWDEGVNRGLTGLIASLSPAERRQMTAEIVKKLRTSQQQRIKRQQTPDGTPYAARKRQPVRRKKGRIKREIFGKVQGMARVHQYGHRPNKHSRDLQCESRPFLGFSWDDLTVIEDIILRSLQAKSDNHLDIMAIY
ncbi:phage virion morphogenesis protein [Enterobacter quasiroggenkampii]|uniref:phage virion morphogenesis protein n=1 Tax=Enterobacter quasiroggenkampii TaxID=2497436 RepID=UPI0020750E6E|nr:phage virion morphogenesis protein [Enterobacter quasiroggenkampii]MCM7169122.1 phage virion morphogenesis protein [Enterobacter quasiroggenkampii]